MLKTYWNWSIAKNFDICDEFCFSKCVNRIRHTPATRMIYSIKSKSMLISVRNCTFVFKSLNTVAFTINSISISDGIEMTSTNSHDSRGQTNYNDYWTNHFQSVSYEYRLEDHSAAKGSLYLSSSRGYVRPYSTQWSPTHCCPTNAATALSTDVLKKTDNNAFFPFSFTALNLNDRLKRHSKRISSKYIGFNVKDIFFGCCCFVVVLFSCVHLSKSKC